MKRWKKDEMYGKDGFQMENFSERSIFKTNNFMNVPVLM